MSSNSHTGYHGSSATQSGSNKNAYSLSYGRDSDGRTYSNQLGNLSNAQQMNYNSSTYNYSNAPSYTDNNNITTDSGAWRSDSQPSIYDDRRSGTYVNQDTAINDTYLSNSYTKSNTGQSAPQNHASGLRNLAYASEIEAADSRSNNVQTTQRYESEYQPSYSRQDMRPSIDAQSRYALNPPPTAASYPMQTQTSSSSTSSQQQAMNAAAALAGAVNRRYPPAAPKAITSLNNTSSGQNDKFGTSNKPPPTSSPRMDNARRQQQTSSQVQQSTTQMANHSRTRTASREPQSRSGTDSISARANTPQRSANNTRVAQQSANGINSILSNAQDIAKPSDTAGNGVTEGAPNFIDPARVFNPYRREHEMKRLRAEAEAKRKAEEEAKTEELRKMREADEAKTKPEEEAKAEEARKAKEKADKDARQRTKVQAGKKAGKGTQTKPSDAAPAEATVAHSDLDDQAAMAAEMKAMMEKMKAFRSRDPAFFQKMWDDIRKPASNTGAATIQSPSPQLVMQSLFIGHGNANTQRDTVSTPRQVQVAETSNHGHSHPENSDPISLGQSLVKNGYKVVVENNSEGLPDLGRFPAERRIRNATYNNRTKPRNTPGASEQTAGEFAISSVAALDGSPLPPASSTPAALSNMFPSAMPTSTTDAGQTKPNNKQTNATIWPVEKRTALINTALRVLKSNPENANVSLTEAEFHEMLSTNPSYIGLCEMLEKKGLHFHRNVFARDLLNSVPELENAASKAKTTTPSNKSGQSTGPVPPAMPVPPSGQPAYPPAPQTQYPPIPYGPTYGPNSGFYPHPQGQHPPPHPSYPMHSAPITFTGHPPNAFPQPPGPGHMPFQPPQHTPSRPPPIPGSKEAAARKRDFSELIDLTELGDNDDYVMPSKHARLDDPDSDTEMDRNAFKAFQTPSNVPMSTKHPTPTDQYGRPLPLQSNPRLNAGAGLNTLKVDGIPEPSSRILLAKPLNKGQSISKLYYDPRTVARDILIATGRHPSERPLNVHLAGMLGKYIELDSDVATFEWEEIDPGGPPAPKVELTDLPASKPRFKLGDRVHRRRRGPRKLIDKMRQPDQDKRTVATPDQSAPSAVFKVTPTSQLPQRVIGVNERISSSLRHSLLASEQEALATPSLHDPTIFKTPRVPIPSIAPITNSGTSQNMETPPPRKRGRPPGSKNKFPTVAGLKEQAIKVNIPRRDDPIASLKEKDKFRCKWKKCNANLINLDTLRKHIGKVHRPTIEQIASEGYTCWWKRCRLLAQDADGAWVTTEVFEDWEDWLSHVEKEHVAPIAAKWGDGPPTHHIDPIEIQQDRIKYLSTIELRPDGSEHLVETTPLISAEHNASHLPDVLNLTSVHPDNTNNDRAEAELEALRYFMQAHKIKRKSREASEEFIKAMVRRLEKIGPGIDRGGCTLITEDMRDTFVQNPAIRRVIKDDA